MPDLAVKQLINLDFRQFQTMKIRVICLIILISFLSTTYSKKKKGGRMTKRIVGGRKVLNISNDNFYQTGYDNKKQ